MALVKDKPEELTPQNDLDDIEDPDAPPDPAEIRLAGKCLAVLESPPGRGEDLVLMIRVKVNGEGVDYHEDGEEVPYRKTKLIACWKPGTKEPVKKKTKTELDAEAEAEAAENQPALYDDEPEDLDGADE